MPACAFWPYSTPAPTPVSAPFPAVPTLILSGADDLRTPTANAREVAAQIPGSQLLVVPDVGHSVLGSDLSGCAAAALQALFKPARIKACTRGPRARIAVPPDAAGTGAPGRCRAREGLPRARRADPERARADARRLRARGGPAGAQHALGGQPDGINGLRVGGLRAGWARLEGAVSSSRTIRTSPE